MFHAPLYRRRFDLSFGIWHKILTRLWMELWMGFHYILNPPRMFPAATAVTVARNVARRGVFSHFCLFVQVLLSLNTFSHGLPRQP